MAEKLPPAQVRFDVSDGSAIVPYERPHAAARLEDEIERAGFTPKREHHITLLPRLEQADLAQIGEHQLRRMKAMLDGAVIDDALLIPDRVYEIRKDKETPSGTFERRSIIIAAQSDAIDTVLARLAFIGMTPHAPFKHMTIATAGEEPHASRGIGIDSLKEFLYLDRRPFPPRQ